MSRQTGHLDDRYMKYVQRAAFERESDTLRELRLSTETHPMAIMQISAEQGCWMALTAQSIGTKRAIEVGVFTGYSALCIAEVLPADGLLVACDISQEYTSIAKAYWKRSGLSHLIDLRIGPATATLQSLLDAGETGTFDFAFIDADKEGYDVYYEQCLRLLRPGGLIAIDNIFMHGRAIDPVPEDLEGLAIHAVTQKVLSDGRVDCSLVPIGDGVMLIRKRPSLRDD